jgi:hypothetical protein
MDSGLCQTDDARRVPGQLDAPGRHSGPHKVRSDPESGVFARLMPMMNEAGVDRVAHRPTATYRQRISHFTEALELLSEADKDLIMGRALLARRNWT